jgi:ornithine cyclodeaminase/alanine dehydrogenase-like protein (mu-crystallin family)
VLVISQEEVARLLDVDDLLDALERAFVELSAGRASVPPRIAAFSEKGLLGAMPGYVDGVLAAKLVTLFPDNEPSHQALIAVFDADTGEPKAVMDGTHITAIRTGGGAAVSTRALAREDAKVLAILGAGVQGRSHLETVGRVRDFQEVRIASRNPEHARAFAAETSATAFDTFEEAVRGADVVCCCTSAAEPILRREWLDSGTHLTSVGSSMEGPELDRETVTAGLLVIESRVAFQPPPAGSHELEGLEPSDAVELGEVLSGTHPGRSSDDQITVYKSMGHAVEDAAAAALVLRASES